MLFPQLYTTSAALSKCLGFLLANLSSLHLIEPYKEELVSCQRHNYPGTKMPPMCSHLVWANIDAYFYWISTSMWREVFCLEQASIKWTWAVVGAGCGKSHIFQGGCDDFQCVCNDAQRIQKLGSHYLYCFFSLFFHASIYPVGPAFGCCYFLKELSFWSENLHSLQFSQSLLSELTWKAGSVSVFQWDTVAATPRVIQSPDHQDWDRRHSCDNHIMSCEIRIFNEAPLSPIQIRVCHPPEKAETFPDWLNHLYWSSISIYFTGTFNPKNSSWL